jgi:hypothetical protein
MKIVRNLLAGIFVVVLVLVGVQMFASETGEVVVITTRDAEGPQHKTRVWIVDSDGRQWLRAGSDQSGWYQRLMQTPTLQLERNGVVGEYGVEPVPAQIDTINRLMHDKYGWADSYVGMLFGRDHAMAIRLDPRQPDA